MTNTGAEEGKSDSNLIEVLEKSILVSKPFYWGREFEPISFYLSVCLSIYLSIYHLSIYIDIDPLQMGTGASDYRNSPWLPERLNILVCIIENGRV